MGRLISLSVLVAAVEEGSLAVAARRFGLSAAIAGKHVSAIEAGLSAWLLHRTTRRLSPIDIDQTYYEHYRRILEAFDEARREASDSQGVARGVLRIAAPVTFSAMRLGGVVACYIEDRPSVTVEAQLGDRYVDFIDAGVNVAIWIGRSGAPELATCRLAPC